MTHPPSPDNEKSGAIRHPNEQLENLQRQKRRAAVVFSFLLGAPTTTLGVYLAANHLKDEPEVAVLTNIVSTTAGLAGDLGSIATRYFDNEDPRSDTTNQTDPIEPLVPPPPLSPEDIIIIETEDPESETWTLDIDGILYVCNPIQPPTFSECIEEN